MKTLQVKGCRWQVLRTTTYWSGVLIAVMAAIVLAGAAPVIAQDAPPVTYQRYDVDFDVRPDGSFVVRETQQIRFDGEFSQAFAEIPLDYTTRIDGVSVTERGAIDLPYTAGGQGPGTFSTEYDGNNLYVDWTFAPTQPGEVRTFVVEYTVTGGLWIYPDGDLLEWRAVPADRSGVPVEASRVVVALPPDPATGRPVPTGQLTATSFDWPSEVQIDDGRVTFDSSEPIPDGLAMLVQVGFPHGIVSAEAQPWQVAEDSAELEYTYLSNDTSFTFDGTGSVQVEERDELLVTAGALRQGISTLTHTGMDDVVDVAVSEGERAFTPSDEPCDYCFSVSQTQRHAGWVSYDPRLATVVTDESLAGSTEILYTVPALVAGETASFTQRYTLHNALHIADDGQTFTWTIIFDEQDVTVDAASVRIDLPPGVEPAEVQVTGGALRNQPDGTLRLEPVGVIISYEPWTWSLTLPPNATGAVKSQWQQDMEAARQEGQQAAARQARREVLLGALALAILSAGLLGLLLLWYRHGRDEPVPLPAEYIAEPPSDLAPGIVAYLLDEKPSIDGVLASLFHLATLGLLRIRLLPQIAVGRNWDMQVRTGEVVETPDGRQVAIPGHLATLFNALMPIVDTKTSKTLDEIAGPLQAALPHVYDKMGEEIAPLFDMLPDKARGRWRGLGIGLALLGALALFYSSIVAIGYGVIVMTPALALLLVGTVWIVASRWMPRRRPEGAREAAKWRAFRRYLHNLEDYANQAEAQEILDRYFAYAVALDAQEVVLRDAERLEAHMPVWTRPVIVTSTPSASPGGASSPFAPTLSWQPAPAGDGGASSSGGQPADWSLSGQSRRMGASLSLASLSLGRTLSAATGGGGSTMDAMNRAVRSSSGSSATRYSGSSSRSSFSSSRSSSSRASSSRSSSSRSSGGGGRRGFR
jgi:hypothetical protein